MPYAHVHRPSPRAALAMGEEAAAAVFGPGAREEPAAVRDLVPPPVLDELTTGRYPA